VLRISRRAERHQPRRFPVHPRQGGLGFAPRQEFPPGVHAFHQAARHQIFRQFPLMEILEQKACVGEGSP